MNIVCKITYWSDFKANPYKFNPFLTWYTYQDKMVMRMPSTIMVSTITGTDFFR